jgi:hypothetical protein
MSGPEHYRQAELLLESCHYTVDSDGTEMYPATEEVDPETGDRVNTIGNALAAAQVHATLALAAATVATKALGPQEMWGGHAFEAGPEWQEVTS